MTRRPSRLLTPPSLIWPERGGPVSGRYDDIYFSPEDGLAETRHVFLEGTGLPEAWHTPEAKARRHFTILETGFGTGLNFLAAWDLWRRQGPTGMRLHFVSAEAFPLSPRQMRAAHARWTGLWPALAPLSAAFLEQYETPLPGFHRFHFGTVHLTLMHGDAAAMLGDLTAQGDAWFLDGFAPARNPSMWSQDLFEAMAAVTRPCARIATFTVAGTVRRGLSAAGFKVDKAPGFGRKRDMLTGRFEGHHGHANRHEPWFAPAEPDPGISHVHVVGGGIAGASVAAAFIRRDLAVQVHERRDRLAAEGSGNPLGIVMPRPTVDDTPAGHVHSSAFAYTRRLLGPTQGLARLNGVVQLTRSLDEWQRAQRLIAASALPPDMLRPVTRREASDLAGIPVAAPGLFYTGAGSVDPAAFVEHLAQGAQIALSSDTPLPPMENDGLTVLANGLGARFGPDGDMLSLRASLGQLAFGPALNDVSLARVVTYGGYAAPLAGGGLVLGATYTPVSLTGDLPAPEVSFERQDHILGLMEGALPDLRRMLRDGQLDGRAAYRATTPDHLPLAGPAPRTEAYRNAYQGLHKFGHTKSYPQADYWRAVFYCTGLGSRGLVTAPLLGELVASQALGEPWPVENSIAKTLHPARFFVRALKRAETPANQETKPNPV